MLFHYLRKSHSRGMVVSLNSGGAGSSAVTTLVWLMTKLGVSELGAKKFAARLPQIRAFRESRDAGSDGRPHVDLRLPGDPQQRRDDASRRGDDRQGYRRRIPSLEHRRPRRRLHRHRLASYRSRADLGPRRRRSAEHPSPGPRPSGVAARQPPRTRPCWSPATAARRPSATPPMAW